MRHEPITSLGSGHGLQGLSAPPPLQCASLWPFVQDNTVPTPMIRTGPVANQAWQLSVPSQKADAARVLAAAFSASAAADDWLQKQIVDADLHREACKAGKEQLSALRKMLNPRKRRTFGIAEGLSTGSPDNANSEEVEALAARCDEFERRVGELSAAAQAAANRHHQVEAEFAEERKSLQRHINELEQARVLAHERAERSRLRGEEELRERMATLEWENEQLRGSETGHGLVRTALKGCLADMEEELHECLKSRDGRQERALKLRVVELEEELAECRKTRLKSHENSVLLHRIAELQEELELHHSRGFSQTNQPVVHRDPQLELERREQAEQIQDLETEISTLERKLADETSEVLTLRQRLEDVEKELALSRKKELQSPLDFTVRPQAPKEAFFQETENAAVSVYINISIALRSLSCRIAPPAAFSAAVESYGKQSEERRQALITAARMLTETDVIHDFTLMSEIPVIAQSINSGASLKEMKESLLHFPGRAEVEKRRQECRQEVALLVQQLKELRVPQHEDRGKDLADRVDSWCRMCENEMRLLRSASAIKELPDTFLETLAEVYQSGLGDTSRWEGGFTPLHWAAQNGRRDILEYFLRQDGGIELAESYEKQGRNSFFYAQSVKGMGLVRWLRERTNSVTPMHFAGIRPADAWGLPPPPLRLLEQIEMHGWQSARWDDGFTLLHFAAGGGYGNLCAYLVRHIGADPTDRDSKDRSPLDYARKGGHAETAQILEELMQEYGEHVLNLSSFTGSGDQSRRRREYKKTTKFEMDLQRLSQLSSSSSGSSHGGMWIPEEYLQLIERIREEGWHSMEWQQGYTMLHWAAKHNLADFCREFISLGADPYATDFTGRDAMAYAQDFGCDAALEALQAPPGSGRGAPFGVPTSNRRRDSLIPTATVKGKALDNSLLD